MIGSPGASGARTLLVLLVGAFSLHLSTPTLSNGPHKPAAPGLVLLRGEERREEEQGSFQHEDEELQEELFKDVDPKTLAAVLLEALNRSQTERKSEAEEEDKTENREVRRIKEAEGHREGRQALELLIAAQDKEREREEEEKKKAQHEEEKLTEKVKSRTTSQIVEVKPEVKKGEAHREEMEEQLSPEELRSLETVMKEFPSLSTASRRTSRGYSTYNDVLKDEDAVTKKKLKWQEETQKGVNFPTFRGGNFMDEFEDVAKFQRLEEDEMEADDLAAEVLSPEEEEAQARAEQEELSRQAAEAQRAKMEEEKLADIASDMLLQYMGNANRKYTSSLSNAAEDKRSDEEEEVDNDIDPQTIDKLIEISSKLHLPADDVVDIINDVEKKKKKDVPSEIPAPQIPTNQNSLLVSKQPSAATNLLKAWFLDTLPSRSQDNRVKPAKPLLANHDMWPKLQKESKPKMWLEPPPSGWSRYSPYFTYPLSYPVYHIPPPRPKPRYYVPQAPLTLPALLGGSRGHAYNFPPRRRFRNWVQPRLRTPLPPILQPRPYYTRYPLPGYPNGVLRPFPISKPRSLPRMGQTPPPQSSFYYSAASPRGYYGGVMGKQGDEKKQEHLKRFIQQILTKRPQMLD
ncbi:uncharacterized protein vgf [Genypterus blacodes]|uniref:uncharacterized protein vgf n=1 Tax=Genypterus blacodes TaxID=154954 RepID=UPI003F75E891